MHTLRVCRVQFTLHQSHDAVVSYTPFTRPSKHRANDEQMYSIYKF